MAVSLSQSLFWVSQFILCKACCEYWHVKHCSFKYVLLEMLNLLRASITLQRLRKSQLACRSKRDRMQTDRNAVLPARAWLESLYRKKKNKTDKFDASRRLKFTSCCAHLSEVFKSQVPGCCSDIVPNHYEAVNRGLPNGGDAEDGRAPGAASTATRELDDLMDSLSDFKVGSEGVVCFHRAMGALPNSWFDVACFVHSRCATWDVCFSVCGPKACRFWFWFQ